MDFELGLRAGYDPGQLQTAADEFKLGTIYKQRDLGGVYNLNVWLHTASGEYVLRVYRPWVDPERIEFLQDLRRRLVESGLPVPRPLGWRRGDSLGFGANRLLEVEAYIRPEPVVFSWEKSVEAYAMLGRLHRVLSGLTGILEFVPPKVHNYGHPADLLRMLRQTRQEIEKRAAAKATARALEVCDRTTKILVALARWWEREGKDLPRQLVHGDYGGENILWRQGKIAALLDFDLADIHERVFDLAYTTYWLFDRLRESAAPSHWPWHKLPVLLMAYREQAPADWSAEELQAIPYALSRVPLYWIATAGYESDPVKAVLDRATSVDKSNWLITHVEAVLEQITPG